MQRTTVAALIGIFVVLGLIVAGIVMVNRGNKPDTAPATNQQPENYDTVPIEQEEEEPAMSTRKLENFSPLKDVKELQFSDIKQGDGAVVPEGATVRAHYTGALAADGTVFQSSREFGNDPIEFNLAGVISGWTRGVPGMKVGGIRRLVIPAALAYGANPPPNSGIPKNADLVFDIELVSIKQ
jgi:FKBP-type peptidyl-prolyl cis-trans isomerase